MAVVNMPVRNMYMNFTLPFIKVDGDGAADFFDPDGTQAQALYDHLTCERELMVFSDGYGAGSHCRLERSGSRLAGSLTGFDEKLV